MLLGVQFQVPVGVTVTQLLAGPVAGLVPVRRGQADLLVDLGVLRVAFTCQEAQRPCAGTVSALGHRCRPVVDMPVGAAGRDHARSGQFAVLQAPQAGHAGISTMRRSRASVRYSDTRSISAACAGHSSAGALSQAGHGSAAIPARKPIASCRAWRSVSRSASSRRVIPLAAPP